MKVTTKTGDKGNTGLYNQRVDKDHIIIELLGHIDEVMAHLILAQSHFPKKLDDFKKRVDELILITAIVAGFKDESEFPIAYVTQLETEIKAIADSCSGFVYPFDDPYRAQLNLIRTVVRRMERVMIRAYKESEDLQTIRVYTNRLSDYIFILINK
jgi:cob(I)alamin adenosyltransferase